MIHIIHLFYLRSKRGLVSDTPKKRLPLIILFLILLFSSLQVMWMRTGEAFDSSLAGWVILGIFLFTTFAGLLSNQLPFRMEDVTWLYTSPYPLSIILYAQLVWRVLWKGLLWLFSAFIGDILFFFIFDRFIWFMGKAFVLWILFSILETWMLAVSSVRYHQWLHSLLWATGILFGLAYGLAVYFLPIRQSTSAHWLSMDLWIKEIGGMFLPFPSVAGWIFLILLGLFSLFLIRATADRMESKERLVQEADFWLQFETNFHFSNQSVTGIAKDRESWWGLGGLNGIFSFLWFEILLVKKNRWVHIINLTFLIGVIPFMIHFFPDLFMALFIAFLFGTLITSYLSSLTRHAKSGDLFLIPGSLWKKGLLLEISSTLWILILFLYAVAWFLLYGKLDILTCLLVLLYGVSVYILFISIRWLTLLLTYAEDANLLISTYYKNLFSLLSGSLFFILTFLQLDFLSPFLGLSIMLILSLLFWSLPHAYWRQRKGLLILNALSISLFLMIRVVLIFF